MVEPLTTEQLERYYTRAGKDGCPECEQYAELFVYRAKNTLIFEANRNIYWDLKDKQFSNRLLTVFATEGYQLNRVVIDLKGDKIKARIEDIGSDMFTIKNPVLLPSGANNFEMFLAKNNYKAVNIYKRKEQVLCADCIFTAIQDNLRRSVNSTEAKE